MIHPIRPSRLHSFRTHCTFSISRNLNDVTESPPPAINRAAGFMARFRVIYFGDMLKIIAVCDEEQGCPLYRRDNRLDFSPPIVNGIDGVPVCAVAVEALQKGVTRIMAGEPSTAFGRVFCGGCPAGKAYWSFEPVIKDTEATLSAGAQQVILNS